MKGKVTKFPEHGDTRVVRRFLWFPRRLAFYKDDSVNQWRWLEFAWIHQEYYVGREYAMWCYSEWAEDPNAKD